MMMIRTALRSTVWFGGTLLETRWRKRAGHDDDGDDDDYYGVKFSSEYIQRNEPSEILEILTIITIITLQLFRFKLQGTDLMISQASWADMGRFVNVWGNALNIWFSTDGIFRFMCNWLIYSGSRARLRMGLEWTWSPASSIPLPLPSMTTVNNSTTPTKLNSPSKWSGCHNSGSILFSNARFIQFWGWYPLRHLGI